MQEHVLSVVKDPSLVVHAIWTPILPTDRAITGEARARLTDPRVKHWWDATRWAQDGFRAPLHLPPGTPAWDVYLVYAPGVRWQRVAPPGPTFFMHQLRKLGPRGRLHGPALADAVRKAGR